jgi:hypothetical protein
VTGHRRDRLRRLHCPSQIAAVKRRESFSRQSLTQGLRLCAPPIRERAIKMSLPDEL